MSFSTFLSDGCSLCGALAMHASCTTCDALATTAACDAAASAAEAALERALASDFAANASERPTVASDCAAMASILARRNSCCACSLSANKLLRSDARFSKPTANSEARVRSSLKAESRCPASARCFSAALHSAIFSAVAAKSSSRRARDSFSSALQCESSLDPRLVSFSCFASASSNLFWSKRDSTCASMSSERTASLSLLSLCPSCWCRSATPLSSEALRRASLSKDLFFSASL
mmetsp:Transcript_114878/g.181330  ORF Transcript_114878/g.181330 Transcript_114878/m.181330 type:complete len:236 (+) Transcript_114878:1133-1840(+)